MRRLKRYLWSKIAAKVERYARCRQCLMLVLIVDESGEDDTEALRDHLGHVLEEVTWVGFLEWVRIWAR